MKRTWAAPLSYFPLAGLSLGALLVGLNYALSLILPRGVVDLLLVTAPTVATGILHLDELAEVFF